MLLPTYPIRTERLTLRPYVEADFDAALSYWSRDDVTRYLLLDTFTAETFRERLAVLMTRDAIRSEGDVLTLAIVPDGTDVVVGDVTLFWHSELHRAGEVGYLLHPDHQGHGYAREATRPLLRMAFEQMELHRIIGRLDGRNAASAAVLRGLGMRQEAHLVQNEWIKGEWTDEVIFAMLRDEWLAQRPPAHGR